MVRQCTIRIVVCVALWAYFCWFGIHDFVFFRCQTISVNFKPLMFVVVQTNITYANVNATNTRVPRRRGGILWFAISTLQNLEWSTVFKRIYVHMFILYVLPCVQKRCYSILLRSYFRYSSTTSCHLPTQWLLYFIHSIIKCIFIVALFTITLPFMFHI